MQRGILWILSFGIVGASLAVANQPAVGKEKAEAKKVETKAAETKSETVKTEKKKDTVKKSANRLPPHYGDVVTEDQRDKIATVYAKFNTKLAKLKAQIEEVSAERDNELEQLLTAEQKEKLAKIKEEAKAKRLSTAKS
jgi:hypothetical protein